MKRRLLFLAIILTFVWSGPASANGVNFFWFTEYGISSLGPGYMAPDPLPGGLSSALTYYLPFPAVTAGDVFIWEDQQMTVLSDVIRFTGYNTLIFYSEIGAGHEPGVMADTGFPSIFWQPTANIFEMGTEGNNWAFYAPAPGMPGYYSEVYTEYQFISDVVPVPTSVLLFGSGLLGLAGLGWRLRS